MSKQQDNRVLEVDSKLVKYLLKLLDTVNGSVIIELFNDKEILKLFIGLFDLKL